MKSNSIFSGIILIGFGLYYLLERFTIDFLQNLHTWPTLLCITGVAFLVQAYKANHYDSILPGVIFFGFGVHFHVINTYHIWPNHLGVFILIISLGLLLQANKTKDGYFPGIVLLIISMLLLFNDKLLNILGVVQTELISRFSVWAIVLIALGLVLLFIKKK
ncbi:hypothetical protein IEO70_05440 [Bacillus sp. AGMB 02131]|uniref:LiaF transmembrane domain-containing protein n=1 Tax=Peribacillus faecalis TaxID=2772559 RepID=A0A927CUH3_9BACI|nr:DUF5668 domain-containing protein [Peribacillus faecalis]MBD3107803.1 hypothetical protein [Peribacillus faecalis]